jgi:hypothetical protein
MSKKMHTVPHPLYPRGVDGVAFVLLLWWPPLLEPGRKCNFFHLRFGASNGETATSRGKAAPLC